MSRLKPDGKQVHIAEQIIDDPVSGLSLQFEAREDGGCKLKIYGDLPHGNREIIFDRNGHEAGAGTVVGRVCPPNWLQVIES